jgi:hypothetical protein
VNVYIQFTVGKINTVKSCNGIYFQHTQQSLIVRSTVTARVSGIIVCNMYSKIAVKCYWWPFWQDFPTIQKNWQWCIEKTLVSLLTISHLIPFCEKNLCLDQKKNNSRKWNIILWFWTFSSLKSKNHTYKSISLSIQPKPELNLCVSLENSQKKTKNYVFQWIEN